MNNIYEIAAAIYLLIGILFGTIGPAGKDIAKEVDRARGSPLTNAFMEREAPSEVKLFFFRITITLGFVFLWPFFIYGIMKEHNKSVALDKRLADERAEGIWFHYMGGHGVITCKDCDHSEEVTSFIHGVNSSSSGFQCQACGKLSSIRAGSLGRAHVHQDSLQCECGGPLKRDKVIFCPICKSKNLSYQMQYIT